MDASQRKWLRLANTLTRTCQRQLAICPISEAHQVESANATLEGRAILNVLKEFSREVRFAHPSRIIETQVWESARRWSSSGVYDLPDPDVNRVIDGYAPHAWWPSLTHYPEPLISDGLMEDINRLEDRGHTQLKHLWNTWCRGGRGDFASWVREEIDSVVKLHRTDSQIRSVVRAAIESCDHDGDDTTHLVDEYLRSDCLEHIPRTSILAVLAAGLRHRAVACHGEKAKNRGMRWDLETLALLLPYCDIMLVDKYCHNLVCSNPVAEALGTMTKRVYCASDLDSMIGDLEALEAAATDEHRQMVELLYGIPASDWLNQARA
jgi:hypothetical protein